MNEHTELFILQPTTFCNVACSYCYLPDRSKRNLMSDYILDLSYARLFASPFFAPATTTVWHAGEPMAAGLAFYKRALAAQRRHHPEGMTTHNAIQTNGTLISREWAAFFREEKFRVGLSIDGPEAIHDAYRKRRSGEGTFKRAMEGVRILREEGIEFHVIAVVTDKSLAYANEIYDFFLDLGVKILSFNFEEIEGVNSRTSLNAADAKERVTDFLKSLFRRAHGNPEGPSIRQYTGVMNALRAPTDARGRRWQTASPIKIITVDYLGNFSTFCPELHGQSTKFGKFVFGNVAHNTFESTYSNDRFWAVMTEIEQGIAKCRAECSYFDYCGGGQPANKYFETGSFATSETQHCRTSRQATVDAAQALLRETNLPG